MPWTTPRTWVTGEIVTSSIMNTDHRDNLLFLKGNSRELIQEQILGAGASTVTFSSIPATYRELQIIGGKIKTDAASSQSLYCRFNGDGSTNYGNNQQGFRTEIPVGTFGGTNVVAQYTGSFEMRIPYYSLLNCFIPALVSSFTRQGSAGTTADISAIQYPTGWQAGGTALNSIAFFMGSGNIIAGSQFALYGIT